MPSGRVASLDKSIAFSRTGAGSIRDAAGDAWVVCAPGSEEQRRRYIRRSLVWYNYIAVEFDVVFRGRGLPWLRTTAIFLIATNVAA